MAILHGNPDFEALKAAAKRGEPGAQAKMVAWIETNAQAQIAAREDRLQRKAARDALAVLPTM